MQTDSSSHRCLACPPDGASLSRRSKPLAGRPRRSFRGLLAGLAAAMGLLVLPVHAGAADASAQLHHFIENVSSARGQFSQQTRGPQGRGKPAQSGLFSFQRPGKFKWEVRKPYEQLVVSDGVTVFQYDPDLAQVTRRPVGKSVGASPAAILFGSGSFEASFSVEPLPDNDGLQWLRAKPRSPDAGFSHVDIGLRDNLPARLELLDSFGQTTRVDLDQIEANPRLDAGTFDFVPPAGADVVTLQ